MPRKADPFARCPFRILYDQREGAPWLFHDIRESSGKHRQVVIETVKCHLPTGDYAIEGFQGRFVIERKSQADLFQSLCSDQRDREEFKFARMNQLEQAILIVESSFHDILYRPPEGTGANPSSVAGTYFSWTMKYPRVQWHFFNTRQFAEVACYRFLYHWWQKNAQK